MTAGWFPFFRSSPSKTDIVRLEVDYNLDDMPGSVIALIKTMQPAFQGDKPCQLDLRRCGYLGPYAGAIIVTTLLESRLRNRECSLVLPTDPPQLANFCRRSALEHFAGLGPMPEGTEPQPATIPMRVLQKARFSDPDPIVELIRRHVRLDDEVEEYLRICINEIVQNVEDHAKSPVGAVAAARFIFSKNQIRIAIVDRGKGIGTTVRGKHPEISSNAQVLARVMEGGISAKSRPNNMGVGISNLCAIIQHQLKGRVFIVSEDSAVNRQPERQDHWTHLDHPFPGTAVFLNVPVDY